MVSQDKPNGKNLDGKTASKNRDWGMICSPNLLKLDQLGLDPFEYRMYARIVQRAWGNGECTESIPNMAKGCRMGEAAARRALKGLEKTGLISMQSRQGQPSLIRPQSISSLPSQDSPTRTGSDTGTRVKTEGGTRVRSERGQIRPVSDQRRVPVSDQRGVPVSDLIHELEGSELEGFELEVLIDSVEEAAALDPDPEPPLLLRNFPEPDPEARQGATQLGSEPTHPAQDFGQASRPQPRKDLKLGMGGDRSPYAGGSPREKVFPRTVVRQVNWAPKAPWSDEKQRLEFDRYLRVVYASKVAPEGNIGGYVAAIVNRIGQEGPDPSGQDAWGKFLKASLTGSSADGGPEFLTPEAIAEITLEWTQKFERADFTTPDAFQGFPLRALWLEEMAADSFVYSRESGRRSQFLRRWFVKWLEVNEPANPQLRTYQAGPKYSALTVVPINSGAGQVVFR